MGSRFCESRMSTEVACRSRGSGPGDSCPSPSSCCVSRETALICAGDRRCSELGCVEIVADALSRVGWELTGQFERGVAGVGLAILRNILSVSRETRAISRAAKREIIGMGVSRRLTPLTLNPHRAAKLAGGGRAIPTTCTGAAAVGAGVGTASWIQLEEGG